MRLLIFESEIFSSIPGIFMFAENCLLLIQKWNNNQITRKRCLFYYPIYYTEIMNKFLQASELLFISGNHSTWQKGNIKTWLISEYYYESWLIFQRNERLEDRSADRGLEQGHTVGSSYRLPLYPPAIRTVLQRGESNSIFHFPTHRRILQASYGKFTD